MRRLSILVIAIAIVGLVVACSQKQTEEVMPVTVNAADVYAMMTEGMSTYVLFPGTAEMIPGKSPHGAFVTILVNDVALKSIEAKNATFDDGSLIVKKNYGPDKAFGAYTIMYKAAGYYPDGGDWYWAKYDEAGVSDLEGEAVKAMFVEKGEGCIACHAQVKDMDWAFTPIPK
jgi:hypothetical protein